MLYSTVKNSQFSYPIISYIYTHKQIHHNKLRFLSKWYLLIPVFMIAGCKNNSIPAGNVNATVIEYKVTYLTEKAGKIPTKMLPGKMTVIFAGHYAFNKIEGFFGQFSLIYIGNLRNESVITMLKLFDKKFVYYGKKGDLPCGFRDPGKLSIEETVGSREFLGFNCKELLITSSGDSSFIALSTNEIKVKHPNVTTPYKDIEDVLLEFNTQLSLLEMQLTALSVTSQEISWDIFRVSEDYKEKSREFMENTIHELFK